MKVKLTVQGEVLNGAILQESLVIEYIVETHMCPDCARVAANPNVWNACAQVQTDDIICSWWMLLRIGSASVLAPHGAIVLQSTGRACIIMALYGIMDVDITHCRLPRLLYCSADVASMPVCLFAACCAHKVCSHPCDNFICMRCMSFPALPLYLGVLDSPFSFPDPALQCNEVSAESLLSLEQEGWPC